MAEGQQPPPHKQTSPRGRPPSYPTVVTTTADAGTNREIHHTTLSAASKPRPPSTLGEALQLYELHGNSTASLEACTHIWDEQSDATIPLSRKHNQTVLENLSSTKTNEKSDGSNNLTDTLSALLSLSNASPNKSINDGYNELVIIYNKCLSEYAAGNYEKAGTVLTFVVQQLSSQATSNIETLSLAIRMAFLALDCYFALQQGGRSGTLGFVDNPSLSNTNPEETSINPKEMLMWIEKYSLSLSSMVNNGTQQDTHLSSQYELFKHDELKFRLHLYRSRLLFLDDKNDLEGRTRTARKELKNAMDIYQNKLCIDQEEGKDGHNGTKTSHSKQGSKSGSGGPLSSAKGKGGGQQDVSETTSVSGSLVTSVSDVNWNEGKSGAIPRATFEGMPKNTAQQLQSTTPATTAAKVKKDTPHLQVRHESVLYLKANLEFLRGNTSKSLKLCAEARSAGKKSRRENGETSQEAAAQAEDTMPTSPVDGETQMASDYDEAIYYNNLALLHQSAGKVHLALHYYSFALSFMQQVFGTNDPQNFWSNGVVCLDITADILNNTSVCAFQASEFKRAYECMAKCVTMSPSVFGRRARCWLRLAQSCIGKSIWLFLLLCVQHLNMRCSGNILNHVTFLLSKACIQIFNKNLRMMKLMLQCSIQSN